MTISNGGQMAGESRNLRVFDPFTGEEIVWLVYPRGTDLTYSLDANLAIGGVIGRDTVVSWFEYFPDNSSAPFEYKSLNQSLDIFSTDARSELDIIAVYYDTITNTRITGFDVISGRPHLPLKLKITQRSMAWSGGRLGEFILVQMEIESIGAVFIKDMYIGLQHFSNVGHVSLFDAFTTRGAVAGYLESWPDPEGCGFSDTVKMFYSISTAGDPTNGQFDDKSPLGAVGIRLLGLPSDSAIINYNWWTFIPSYKGGARWHPRMKPKPGEFFQKLDPGRGFPFGDKTLYFLLSHPEFDYDQITTALDHTTTGWFPRPPEAERIASGAGAGKLVSFGPIDMPPKTKTSFTFAIVAGDSVHTDPTAFDRLFDPHFPPPYVRELDFSNLAHNARMASWVYDNPGVDTDGDGFFGKFRMCDGDTFWYEGDGVPDFRADVPPPSPEVTVMPSEAKLAVRWNGFFSETNVDPFTRTKDFEGYRVYLGLDDRSSSLSIISSFDNLNYNRFKLIQRPNGRFDWVNNDLPFTIDSLQVLFNDQDFNPLNWTRTNPLTFNDTLFRFEKQDFNRSDLTSRNGIHKVYPNAIDPGPDTLLWNDSDLVFDHGRPLPKFYEYELIVGDLLPTVRQYVSVTAFDFGFSAGNIPAKESNKLNNITEAFARTDVDTVESKNLDVYIYPNPYRIDGNYLDRGFENRDGTQANQRAHRVHFVNLPRVCKITIYSLDGDRIDSFDHNFPQGGPEAMHDEWEMITRNGLIPVSGIYYWVVEAETRTQMGKLIIIK